MCSFSSRWYAEIPYLEYSIVKDRAYCFVYKLFSHGVDREKIEKVWIDGFCNWRRAKGSRGKGETWQVIGSFSEAIAIMLLSESMSSFAKQINILTY